MAPRLPKQSDFPSLTTHTIPPPSSAPRISSLLILLHGLGDSNTPYINLAKQLSLPETAILCVQGPAPLPFDIGGFHWGDDVIFDAGGGLDADAGFKRVRELMIKVIKGAKSAGWSEREIVLWGVGQGGMAALEVGMLTTVEVEDGVGTSGGTTTENGTHGATKRAIELGGIITLGGALPSGTSVKTKSRTPVLVCGGTSDSQVPDEKVDRIKACYEFVEKTRWRRRGDGMPRNRDEMLPIMGFLARRLRSRAGVPEGSVELG
jgi:predicted esterase